MEPRRQAPPMPISEAFDRRDRRRPAFDRLLAAARDRFATDGYARTTLDAVAEDAGVTKGSLYHHFKGKTELFEAVVEDEARRLAEDAGSALVTHDDPWAAVQAGLTAFLERA